MAIGLEQFYRRSMVGKLFIAMSEDSFAARARGGARSVKDPRAMMMPP